MRHSASPVQGRNVAIEQCFKPDARDEVIDQG